MEWVILIVSLAVAAYLYYFKKEFFTKHSGFIEFAVVLFTMLFAIYQVRSSTEDFDKIVNRMEGIIKSAEESKKSLKEVENSLADLPTQIDSFSVSINLLNSVVSQQRDKLEATLNDFNSSIKGFQSSVDDMAKRFDRHPKLKIELKKVETDTNVFVSNIVITNFGDLLANMYMIRLQIEETFLDSIKWENSIETMKQGPMRCFQMDLKDSYVTPSKLKPTIIECNIFLKKSRNAVLKVFVYYTSPFGNDSDAFVEYQIKKNVLQKVLHSDF